MRDKILYPFLIVSLLIISACGNRKDVITTPDVEETVNVIDSTNIKTDVLEESEYSYGTVKDYSDNEGCEFVIEMKRDDGSLTILEPFVLDEQFKKDGLKIKMSFTPSRRPSKCLKASTPITINTIEAY